MIPTIPLEFLNTSEYHYHMKCYVTSILFRLEIWPGYVNTIQHYDGGLLLMLDVSHRVLRTDTVLDFLLVACHICMYRHASYMYYVFAIYVRYMYVYVHAYICTHVELMQS